MSDNINYNRFTKTNSFVSAVKPAWHKKGTILPDLFTAEEAIKYANMGYDVAMAPLEAIVKNNDEDTNMINKFKKVGVSDFYATYRTDTSDVFGIVGSRYEVVQNAAAFNFFDNIILNKKAKYETAGVLGKGEIIFLTAKLAEDTYLSDEDNIENYLLFTMGHDGTRPVSVMYTPTRVVCANTLAIALDNGANKIVIRHTKSAHDKIEEAAKIMRLVGQTREATAKILKDMSKVAINDDKLATFIGLTFLSKEDAKKLALEGDYKKADIPTRTVNTMNEVYSFAKSGIGQLTKATEGTLFGAYSAINGYLSNVKEYKSDDAKMKNLILDGADYKLNCKAFNLAKEVLQNDSILNF